MSALVWTLESLPSDVAPEADWLRRIDPTIKERAFAALAVRLPFMGLTGQARDDRATELRSFAGLEDGAGRRISPSAQQTVETADTAKLPAVRLDLTVPFDEVEDRRKTAADLGGEIEQISLAPPGGYRVAVRIDEEAVRALSDDAVLMAVIDDGVAVANQRFRRADGGSRVLSFLDLETRGGAVPQRSYSSADLERAFARTGDGEERETYRALGMIDERSDARQPLRFRGTHGAHVLDVMAGAEPGEADFSRPVIAVQLPSAVVEDRTDAPMDSALSEALAYVLEAARRVSRIRGAALPLVLNFSFGVFAGPHDGTGVIERRLSDFVALATSLGARCDVVLPAGNAFESRTVADLELGAETPWSIDWRVAPDDRTASFLQVWCRSRRRLSVRVEPPRGLAPSDPTQVGSVLVGTRDGAPVAGLYHGVAGNGQELVTVALAPTAADGGDPTVCPHGLWRIGVALDEPGRVELRAQRDDRVSYRRDLGRQAYLDSPDYQRFDPATGRRPAGTAGEAGPVTRRRTLSAYASAGEFLVVGGYRRSDGAAAFYSSAGPSSGARAEPDAAAPSEESPSHRGVLAAGSFSGSVATLNGTSVAAPRFARALADEIAAGGDAQTLLAAIGAHDGAICWPHGGGAALQKDRMGRGRLATTAPPHRRRIES